MKRTRSRSKKDPNDESTQKKLKASNFVNGVPSKILNVLQDAGAVSEETALEANVIISAVFILKNTSSSRIWNNLRYLKNRGDIEMKPIPDKGMKCWLLSVDNSSGNPKKERDFYDNYYADNINGLMNTIRDTGTTEGVVEPVDYSYKLICPKTIDLKPTQYEYGYIGEALSGKSKNKMKDIYGNISADPKFKYALHAILLVLYQCEAFDKESSIKAWDIYYRVNYLIDFSAFKVGAHFAEDAAIYENLCAYYITYDGTKGDITKKKYRLTPDGTAYVERLLEVEPENKKLLDKIAFLIKRDNDILERRRKGADKKPVHYPKKKIDDSSLTSLLELTKRSAFPAPPPSSSKEIRSIMALLSGEAEEDYVPPSNELFAFKSSGEKDEEGYRKEMREFAEKAFREKYHPLSVPELFSFERREKYDDDEHLPQIVDVKLLIDADNDQKFTDAIVSAFKECDMATEVKELPAGNFLWVGLDKYGTEYVLNTAIERLTLVEHCVLAKDKLKKSKSLLRGTHMNNLTFIVEGDGAMLENPDDSVFFHLHKSLNDICSDGTFNLIRTLNMDETIAFLFSVTENIKKEIKDGYGKGLLFWPGVTFRTLNAIVYSACFLMKRLSGSFLQDAIDKFSFKTLDVSAFY